MSSSVIKTYNDLLREEQRVMQKYNHDKAKVINDIRQMRNKFIPGEKWMFGISRWFNFSNTHHFLPKIIDIGLDLITKKYFFKRSSWLATFMGSYIIRILSQVIVGNVIQGKSGQKI